MVIVIAWGCFNMPVTKIETKVEPYKPLKSYSFGADYDSGLTKEELMKKHAMNESEYERVLKSLLEIRARRIDK